MLPVSASALDTGSGPGRRCGVLLVGMIVLGIVTFAALVAFVTLCDRV